MGFFAAVVVEVSIAHGLEVGAVAAVFPNGLEAIFGVVFVVVVVPAAGVEPAKGDEFGDPGRALAANGFPRVAALTNGLEVTVHVVWMFAFSFVFPNGLKLNFVLFWLMNGFDFAWVAAGSRLRMGDRVLLNEIFEFLHSSDGGESALSSIFSLLGAAEAAEVGLTRTAEEELLLLLSGT